LLSGALSRQAFLLIIFVFVLQNIGSNDHLIDEILNPSTLDSISNTFERLQSILKSTGTQAVAWVGEAGGAYNSGHNLVTNAFVFSFW
jgi:heparanase 1